jgi:hypothetical protein
MREVTKADGSKAITTNSEPKHKRPGPEPITTRTVNMKPRLAKFGSAKKEVQNEK